MTLLAYIVAGQLIRKHVLSYVYHRATIQYEKAIMQYREKKASHAWQQKEEGVIKLSKNRSSYNLLSRDDKKLCQIPTYRGTV